MQEFLTISLVIKMFSSTVLLLLLLLIIRLGVKEDCFNSNIADKKPSHLPIITWYTKFCPEDCSRKFKARKCSFLF